MAVKRDNTEYYNLYFLKINKVYYAIYFFIITIDSLSCKNIYET